MAKKKRGHGEGTIYQRKDGRWAGQITVGRDPTTGKPKRKTFYGKTRKEVQEKQNKALYELKYKSFIEPSKMTLANWLIKWLKEYKKPSLRPSTWSTYNTAATVHIIPSIGHILLKDLKTTDLQMLYNEKIDNGRVDGKGGLSSRMIHLIHQVITGALKQAMKEDLIYRNVADAVALPKLRYKDIQPLSLNEVQQFLTGAKGHRLYAAFLVELGTGWRRGELLGLRWKDVDFEKGIVQVKQTLSRIQTPNGFLKTQLVFQEPKTKKSQRPIPLPMDIYRELKAHKARQNKEKIKLGDAYQDYNLVFCYEDGRPIDPRNFTRRYEIILRNAGLHHVSFHNLRHTFASLLLDAGEHPKVVQELLGHSRINVTMDIYTHVSDGLKEKAASKINELLKLKKNAAQEDGM